ncbi:MAG: LD-carboxypeptidase [Fidelibacterota bacterium]|nr:MAG: LD-carboxypeptidase [Candidatus Neomarinimicrobiota bacterium]
MPSDHSPSRIKPHALFDSGTIGIISPSKWAEPEKMERAGHVLEEAGYKLIWSETTQAREHQFAGPPELRAKELERLFADPDIHAIFCVRGGYGAFRVGDILDYALIQANPKIFMGFSDITTLLLTITQRTGLVTFHGPMLHTFFNGLDPLSFEQLLGVLSGRQQSIDLGAIPGVNLLKAGVARGDLWGGNLFLITIRTGTISQFDTRRKILFLEDVNEPLHKLETMFQHLRRSGQLDDIAGLIVGEISDIPEEEVPFGQTLEDIILEACQGLDIPIVSGVPCGHGTSILTFPLSLPVELQARTGQITLEFLEPPVEV